MYRNKITYLLLALLLLPKFTSVAKAQTLESPVSITLESSPDRLYNQWLAGTETHFNATITNESLQIKEGDVVNASKPDIRYTGNFTIELTMFLVRIGRLWYGGQSTGYTDFVNNTLVHEYLSLPIPYGNASAPYRYPYTSYPIDVHTVDRNLTLSYGYNLTKGPEIVGARPDENLALYHKLIIHLQTYNKTEGINNPNIGATITSYSSAYYIMDTIKQEYIKGKYLDIKTEVELLGTINSPQVNLNKTKYQNELRAINSSITRSDYVNALELIQNYQQFSEPTLIASLFVNLKQTSTLASDYVALKPKFDQLAGNFTLLRNDFNALSDSYTIITRQVNQLHSELETQRRNYDILIAFTAVVAVFIGYTIGRRLSAY